MPQWIRAWPTWSGHAATAWSLCYGALGLYWTLGGAGYPFAPAPNTRRSGSILEGAPVHTVAPIMAALGLLGAIAALRMTRSRTRHPTATATALIVLGWAQAATYALLVPDYSLLGILAFSPVLLVFAVTGVPGHQHLGDILYWHRLNLVVLFIGGLLWAATTLAYQRKQRDRCPHCGRRGTAEAHRITPESARPPIRWDRWGRWAVRIAVVANIPYEVTRLCWYFGIPLGITPQFEREMANTPGMLDIALCLAVAGILGGLLIHGLSHRWGEVYPRWIPWKAGRPVPRALAVVPATVVSLVLIPAGLMAIRVGVPDGMWAVGLPAVLWIVWGLSLGAATYAYHQRRRPPCPHHHTAPPKPAPARS